MDIVIERNRITAIVTVGATAGHMRPSGRPQNATKEIDATGMYVPPGLVDLHLHEGDIPKTPEAEYVYKLWMAHGITAAVASPSRPRCSRNAREGVPGTKSPLPDVHHGPSMSGKEPSKLRRKRGVGACSGGDRDRRVEAQRVPTRDHGSSDRQQSSLDSARLRT